LDLAADSSLAGFVFLPSILLGYNARTNPFASARVPGKTEFERFDNAVRQVLSVPRQALLKPEARENERGNERGDPGSPERRYRVMAGGGAL
jgi:hypothetical protein